LKKSLCINERGKRRYEERPNTETRGDDAAEVWSTSVNLGMGRTPCHQGRTKKKMKIVDCKPSH